MEKVVPMPSQSVCAGRILTLGLNCLCVIHFAHCHSDMNYERIVTTEKIWAIFMLCLYV